MNLQLSLKKEYGIEPAAANYGCCCWSCLLLVQLLLKKNFIRCSFEERRCC